MSEVTKFKDCIPVGVSARHLHLSREHLDALFGKGYELTKKKELSQPGQYASEETVDIMTTKGAFTRGRILGPVRKETQIEISLTDSLKLGITPPIRDSGNLEGSPGVVLVGPNGTITLTPRRFEQVCGMRLRARLGTFERVDPQLLQEALHRISIMQQNLQNEGSDRRYWHPPERNRRRRFPGGIS